MYKDVSVCSSGHAKTQQGGSSEAGVPLCLCPLWQPGLPILLTSAWPHRDPSPEPIPGHWLNSIVFAFFCKKIIDLPGGQKSVTTHRGDTILFCSFRQLYSSLSRTLVGLFALTAGFRPRLMRCFRNYWEIWTLLSEGWRVSRRGPVTHLQTNWRKPCMSVCRKHTFCAIILDTKNLTE